MGEVHITNIASGNDRVAIQVGQIISNTRPPAEAAKLTAFEEDLARHRAAKVTVTNVRSGNATVGFQTDEWHGDIHL